MFKRNPVGWALLPLALWAMVGWVQLAAAQAPATDAARLDVFSHPDGNDYFALSLRPNAAMAAPAQSNVVVLFDTSASQAGPYREKAIESLNTFLAGLAPDDRVKLIAVDLNATPMTETFVEPAGNEIAGALDRLNARVPLGTTDMQAALTEAAASFAGAAPTGKAVVYIGDGMSPANLLGTEEFENLVTSLREANIPVTSYAVGPRLDAQLLGALAGRTGGNMIVQSDDQDATAVGAELASVARAPVFWPDETAWPAAFSAVYPKLAPPLRVDRDSVVIGVVEGEGPMEVQYTGHVGSEPTVMKWTVQPGPSVDDNSYLAQLVERASIEGGVSLPLIGTDSLQLARREVNIDAGSLVKLARQALASGNAEGAQRLAGEVLQRDPQNPEAKAILETAAEGQPAPPDAAAAPEAELNLVGPPPADGDAPEPFAVEGAFAERFEHERNVIAQMITTDVQNTINQARSRMSTEPEIAIQDLKLQMENVRRAPELEPEIRDQLVDQLQAGLREARRVQVEVEQRRQEMHERLATAKERMLINEDLLRTQQKVEQLLDRFNALMDEGRYRLAEEVAAKEAQELQPDNPVPILATHWSRMKGYWVEHMAIRVARQKAVVDTLQTVERSHVPFPDEPPIVYPEAEVWQRLSARRQEKYKSMDLASRGPAERKILEQLDAPTTLEFIETPLQDVIEYLKDLHDIEIQIDTKALDDVGIGSDTPITRNLKGVSLRSALRLMLRELDLTYMIENEVLLITTPEEAETRLSTKVYPVADLVLPIRQSGFSGGFGGLGGMGGMGGGIGGMSGGGVGGFGGGMGGMGGGMGGMGGGMGGGMFAVPEQIQNLLPKPGAGGFKAFSVEDDVRASESDKTDSSASKGEETIQVEIDKDADPNQVWNDYFKSHEPSELAVRDAVRRLMNQKQFDHVIALIQAALRNQHVQSWMYEAMSLAMQADGRSTEEIERAVMSAVDFADNPSDMMFVAAYLEHIGLHDRAVQVCQQVAQVQPLRPEPYVLGLRSAQRGNNLEGIKWATLGILSQAWPEDQSRVWHTGVRVAKATLEKLRAENRKDEAEAYEKALDAAVVRDCVVVVSWTGDADIDLLVEDPTGSICSFRNPRTTSGGVMLGDSYSKMTGDSTNGSREVYVCPKGFAGRYRMLIRRVWGDVTAGKVNVEIFTNYRTKQGKVVKDKVELKKDEAAVAFDLPDGRRKQLLPEDQVANAAVEQLKIRQQLLAQQLAAAVDPRSMLQLARSRNDNGGNGGGGIPFLNVQGAVGYQPVIITLPEGTNLMANAVISADRRYVRVTCVPLFSGVAEVNVFNTSTGTNTEGRGGTGGQGFSGVF